MASGGGNIAVSAEALNIRTLRRVELFRQYANREFNADNKQFMDDIGSALEKEDVIKNNDLAKSYLLRSKAPTIIMNTGSWKDFLSNYKESPMVVVFDFGGDQTNIRKSRFRIDRNATDEFLLIGLNWIKDNEAIPVVFVVLFKNDGSIYKPLIIDMMSHEGSLDLRSDKAIKLDSPSYSKDFVSQPQNLKYVVYPIEKELDFLNDVDESFETLLVSYIRTRFPYTRGVIDRMCEFKLRNPNPRIHPATATAMANPDKTELLFTLAGLLLVIPSYKNPENPHIQYAKRLNSAGSSVNIKSLDDQVIKSIIEGADYKTSKLKPQIFDIISVLLTTSVDGVWNPNIENDKLASADDIITKFQVPVVPANLFKMVRLVYKQFGQATIRLSAEIIPSLENWPDISDDDLKLQIENLKRIKTLADQSFYMGVRSMAEENVQIARFQTIAHIGYDIAVRTEKEMLAASATTTGKKSSMERFFSAGAQKDLLNEKHRTILNIFKTVLPTGNIRIQSGIIANLPVATADAIYQSLSIQDQRSVLAVCQMTYPDCHWYKDLIQKQAKDEFSRSLGKLEDALHRVLSNTKRTIMSSVEAITDPIIKRQKEDLLDNKVRAIKQTIDQLTETDLEPPEGSDSISKLRLALFEKYINPIKLTITNLRNSPDFV